MSAEHATEPGRPIDPQRALEVMAKIGPKLAEAKANRVYMEAYAKTLKATLMRAAEAAGHGSAAAQEREAYADQQYIAHLDALREATNVEEALRWKMTTAQAAIEVWRSLEASNRAMDRSAA